ncbi:MAG: hypothetical protein ACI4DY_15255 [Monoglobaceae bacterium]
MSDVFRDNVKSDAFEDDYTKIITAHMSEFEDRIYEIEEGLSSIEDNEEAIVSYLKDIRCSMPLGLALRRYLCGKFSISYDEATKKYLFKLSDGQTVCVSDYRQKDYDICNDDVKEYTEIFMDINARYNTNSDGALVSEINKAEARRLLRSTKACLRKKMFLISFALHMNSADMYKFLTDVLAEQSYNYRVPDEIIAYYCHTHEEVNNYIEYSRIRKEYQIKLKTNASTQEKRADHTGYARRTVTVQVNSEQDLYKFLIANAANFHGFSQTAYDEFMRLYDEAMENTTIQYSSNDENLLDYEITTAGKLLARQDRINRAIALRKPANSEQLAKEMLRCIPRYTSERMKDGEKIVTNDFIPISNGELGQKCKKTQTTSLPKEITMNLLMSDRLDDLRNRKKPVDRKDLVFMKFYNFGLYLQKKGSYSSNDYMTFIDECNDILMRCGMSKLYPANRFENLIMLSLLSENPFEMFEDIIENSIIAEPSVDDEREKFEKSVREIDYLIKGLPKSIRKEIVSLIKEVSAYNAVDSADNSNIQSKLTRVNALMRENTREIIFDEPLDLHNSMKRAEELLREDNAKELRDKFGFSWEQYKPAILDR